MPFLIKELFSSFPLQMPKSRMSFNFKSTILMFWINRNCFIVQVNSSWLIKKFELDTVVWNIIHIANSLTSKIGNFIHIIPNSIKIDFCIKCRELLSPKICSTLFKKVRESWFTWPNFSIINATVRVLNKIILRSSFECIWFISEASVNDRNKVSLIFV